MLKKILPLNTEPFTKTYPFNAFYLGVLEANGYEINEILLREFMNIHCYYYNKKWHIDFCGSGHIEKNRFITKYDIHSKSISIEQIKDKIINEKYVMLNLNERYLCSAGIEWSEDRYHEWLVYGFDDILGSFYCCGYINQKGLGEYYGSILVAYEDLIIAAKKVPYRLSRFRQKSLRNHSFTINKQYIEKSLTKEDIIRQLLRFYQPKKIFIYHSPFLLNNANGLNLYLQKFKENYIMKNSGEDIYLPDIRNIYEHKKVIKLALKKIECNNELIEKQDALIRDSYSLLLICAKQFLNPQKKSFMKIYNKLLELEKIEKEIIIYAIKNADCNLN